MIPINLSDFVSMFIYDVLPILVIFRVLRWLFKEIIK